MKWWEYALFLIPWMAVAVWAIYVEKLSLRSVVALVAIQVLVLVFVQVYAEARGYEDRGVQNQDDAPASRRENVE